MPFIDEIFVMDDIFSLEEKVKDQYGIPIPNVSYWNSSRAFQNQMAKVLVLPEPSLPWNYYYTYSISAKDRQQVLQNLGVPESQLQMTMGLLLQSSTIAIVNMINLLVHYNRKRLCILQPAYFSVASCCSMFSLDYGIEQISFDTGRPQIPLDKILGGGYDCVWITSPIFCTGFYFDDDHKKAIEKMKSAGLTIIFDESLALPGKELIRSFPIDSKVFAIYSPHKAISVNGLKFAVIVCEKCYEDFLEQWINVESDIVASLKSQFRNRQPLIQIEHISVLFRSHFSNTTSEDNVNQKINDARFAKMSQRYEAEQGENAKKIKALRLELKKSEGRRMDVDTFLETVRRYTNATEITQRMVAELIDHIDVYHAEKKDGVTTQRITIYYN